MKVNTIIEFRSFINELGLEYLENYNHNENLYHRAFVLSYILGYEKEYEYFKKNINLQDIQNTLNEKTILKIAKQRGVIEKLNELKIFLREKENEFKES